ncbi:DMT family transporter [Candidatus Thorarchaeota archaeon]|jgi:drug/metabolite transporter (DMT)-like permease|nr:MAG: DMT family transporter [Candidatus Thorarchaeota archaeon]
MQVTPEFLVGAAIGLLGSALYGLSVVVYRSQADEIRPVAVSSIKMWVAFPFIGLLVLVTVGFDTVLIPLVGVLVLGISVVLGAVVGDTLYLASQERIGVSYAFPIAMSFPLITYFITITILNETPVLTRLAGAFIAVAGVIAVSHQQNKSEDNETVIPHDLLGIGLAIMTAVLYAVGTVLLQVGIAGVDPIGGSFIRVTVGSLAFIPMFAIARYQGMAMPSMKATKFVIVAGFFGMAIGSVLYVIAVATVGAAVMSVLSSSAPVFAVPVSVIFLKEKLTPLAVVGIVLTLVGVFFVILGDSALLWLLASLGLM